MIELGHCAVAVQHREEHVRDGVGAKAVTIGQLGDDALAFGAQLLHRNDRLRRF
jgi:hypothetical protein